MSFRNKLIVARSSLNNYDVTANSSFWFCPFCSKKIKIGGNAMYYRRCSRRPLDFSSSSESSVSSCSDEVSSSDSSDKEIESVQFLQIHPISKKSKWYRLIAMKMMKKRLKTKKKKYKNKKKTYKKTKN